MSCLYNHYQILEFVRKISLKSFEIYQNYLCALRCAVTRKMRFVLQFFFQLILLLIVVSCFPFSSEIHHNCSMIPAKVNTASMRLQIKRKTGNITITALCMITHNKTPSHYSLVLAGSTITVQVISNASVYFVRI